MIFSRCNLKALNYQFYKYLRYNISRIACLNSYCTADELCCRPDLEYTRALASSRILYNEGTRKRVIIVANITPNARLIAIGIRNLA